MIDFLITGIGPSIAKAITQGNRRIKIIFVVAIIFIVAGIIIAALVESGLIPKIYNSFAGAFGVIAGIGILLIYAYQISIDESEAKEEIKKVEEKIKENPNETTATWELGRIKLEIYLNKNLIQVKWIFVWTVIVMMIGFTIIGYGIIKVYQGDTHLNVAILAAVSGLIIEFIGASFLLIYKSIMQQAKDYVTVLERINAVGMSVQILDSISSEQSKLKDETKADLAKKLLELYGGVK